MKAELEHSCQTLWELYYQKSLSLAPELRDEWLRRMERTEEFKVWAVKDLEQFIQDLCRPADGPPCT